MKIKSRCLNRRLLCYFADFLYDFVCIKFFGREWIVLMGGQITEIDAVDKVMKIDPPKK